MYLFGQKIVFGVFMHHLVRSWVNQITNPFQNSLDLTLDPSLLAMASSTDMLLILYNAPVLVFNTVVSLLVRNFPQIKVGTGVAWNALLDLNCWLCSWTESWLGWDCPRNTIDGALKNKDIRDLETELGSPRQDCRKLAQETAREDSIIASQQAAFDQVVTIFYGSGIGDSLTLCTNCESYQTKSCLCSAYWAQEQLGKATLSSNCSISFWTLEKRHLGAAEHEIAIIQDGNFR